MEKKTASAPADTSAPAPAAAPVSPETAAPTPAPVETIHVEGVLDVDLQRGGNGQLLDLARGGKRRPTDPFVPKELIRRFKLRTGSMIGGTAFPPDGRFPNPKMRFIETVDGVALEDRRARFDFPTLTTISPNQFLKMEMKDGRMTTRAVDLFCPIGKGTRGLIVAPPRTGKTTLLRDMALGVLENNPECHVMILLVDERPEEVTDFRRSVTAAEIWASSNDEQIENHIRIADPHRAGQAPGRGGPRRRALRRLDHPPFPRAQHGPQQRPHRLRRPRCPRPGEAPPLFATARKTEEAGSLTIIASVLVETGSRMDDVIFQEFKGTGNMELVLDRKSAEMRLWPAINIAASGTRKEELLIDAKTLEGIHFFRRAPGPAEDRGGDRDHDRPPVQNQDQRRVPQAHRPLTSLLPPAPCAGQGSLPSLAPPPPSNHHRMHSFSEQCLDMARSMLAHNLDSIQADGTLYPRMGGAITSR